MSNAIRRGLALCAFAGFLLASPVFAQAPQERGKDLLSEARDRIKVESQRVEADVREALLQAQRLPSAKAVDVLKAALLKLDDDTALTESRRESLKRMLRDRVRITEVEAKAGATRAEEKAVKTADNAGRRAEEEQRIAEQQKLAQGLKDVRKLQEEGKPGEAKRAAGDLSQRYPKSPAAGSSARTTSTADQVDEARRIMKERGARTVGVYRDVEVSATPPAGPIEFPKDWKEKSAKRLAVKMTDEEKALVKALNTPIPVNFSESAFDGVIEYLQTVTGQTILIDKQAMEEAGVKYDAPVTMKNKSVTLRTVLRKVLGDLGLAYVIKDGSIQVTTPLRAKETLTVRTYYLGDLALVTDFRLPPALTQLQALQNAGQIIDAIQTSIDPPSWRANGGNGTIIFDPRTLSLVVKQSAEVHFMLGGGR